MSCILSHTVRTVGCQVLKHPMLNAVNNHMVLYFAFDVTTFMFECTFGLDVKLRWDVCL